ncbi:P44 outer membrane protein [Anaplasma phagocytophilum str. CRT38]|uniref:p44 outer membrane protein n=1 Tax=Anaplasma phagocytophilum str. CRT38 TaxID=1269275 RepID=S6GBS0_ANAPH|nr:P44 outer membrane protein [Anaplasma phagocytophilum str. CRT38]KDB57513.1 hypothetical protein P030_02760 [Anaplasma phagocytophilum str. CRT35]
MNRASLAGCSQFAIEKKLIRVIHEMYVIPWKIIVLVYGNSANLVGVMEVIVSTFLYKGCSSFFEIAFSCIGFKDNMLVAMEGSVGYGIGGSGVELERAFQDQGYKG